MAKNIFSILVVEDEESLQEIYKEKLRGKGRRIVQAFSAEEALDITRVEAFDMIILDVGLPKASGIDFLNILFDGDDTPELPVVIVSGTDDLPTKIMGFVGGAVRFLSKPVDFNDLLPYIDRIQRRQEQPVIK